MNTTTDIGSLRKSSTDSAAYQHLLNSDTAFQEQVRRVQDTYPEMSPFERLKFPSAMLDIYQGVDGGSAMDETATMLDSSMARQEKSAFNTAIEDPLSFGWQTVKNIPRSTANLIGGVASLVAHPLDTASTAFKLGVGGTANTIESIASLAGVRNPEEIFDLESEEVANQVGDFYVKRYGSMEAAATTLRDDPAGFLSDLGAVITGVGGVIKGGAAAIGATTGAATKSATTLSSLGRGIRTAQGIGTKLVNAGVNMEPLVITGKGVVMAARGAGNAASMAGRAIAPSSVITKALRINPSDISAFANLAGRELPGDFLLRKGILSGGDIAVTDASGLKMTGSLPLGRTQAGIMRDLERLAIKAKSTVDSELLKVKQTYDILDDVPDAAPLLDQMYQVATKYDLKEPREFIEAMLKKERVTLTDLNEMKRLAYEMFNTYKNSNLASDANTAKQIIQYEQSIRQFIKEQARMKGLPDIDILNLDTQKSREILNAMKNAELSSLSKGKNVISLMDGMTGLTAYGFTDSLLVTAGIVISRKMLESTLFLTTMAKYINKLDISQIEMLRQVWKVGQHTKESKQVLRSVIKKTSEDIEAKVIGEQELSRQKVPQTKETPLEPVVQEMLPSPTTLPQEIKTSNVLSLTPEENATGLIGGGGDNMPRKIAGSPSEDFIYHTTPAENLSSIQKEGLKSGGGQFGEGTYFAGDEATLKNFVRDFDVQLRVKKDVANNFGGLKENQTKYRASKEYLLTNTGKSLPAESIEIKTKKGDWIPLKEAKVGDFKDIMNVYKANDLKKWWDSNYDNLSRSDNDFIGKIFYSNQETGSVSSAKLQLKPSEKVRLDKITNSQLIDQFTSPAKANAKISSIPDDLQLLQEVRKYKSAEDFVKEFTDPKTYFQILPKSYFKTPKLLYRGVSETGKGLESKGFGSAVEGKGLYTTTRKEVAKGYAKEFENGVVKEMNPLTDLPNNPLYFRSSNAVDDWLTISAKKLGMSKSDFNSKIGINKFVNLLGHDGVAFEMNGGTTYVKYFGKSQLTDLYNQATK